MRMTLIVVVGLVLGLGAVAGAQKPPTKSKSPSKPSTLGSIGTTQLPGSICKFGTAYTLGKKAENPINLNILSAEYSATRVRTDKLFAWPKADTKLLVVHFTIHNPVSQEVAYGKWLKFTAVTAGGQSIETADAWIDALPNLRLEVPLKPAQKIAGYTVLEVPATDHVEKLIVENASSPGSPVARYPLAGLVKKIAPPYVDPADPSGFTPLKLINAKLGETFQLDDVDVAVTKIEQVDGTGDPLEVQDPDKVYVLVTFQATARGEVDGSAWGFGGGWMGHELIDVDGSSAYGYNNGSLRSGAIDYFEPRCKYGETVNFRKVYVVKRGVQQAYLKLKSDTSREIRWDLGGFTPK